MGMIIPAEKIIRKMFNIEKAGNESALSAGGFFEGALAASALGNLTKLGKKSGGKSNEGRVNDDEPSNGNNIRTSSNIDDYFDEQCSENTTNGGNLPINSLNSNISVNDKNGKLAINMSGVNSGTNKQNDKLNKNKSYTSGLKTSDSSKNPANIKQKKNIKGYKKVGRGLESLIRKNYKSVGRGALKLAGLGMGAVGGSLGVAATIATGNINNLGKFTATGIAAGVGSVHLAENGATALGNTIKNVKKGVVDAADTYRVGANNWSEEEYEKNVKIPRIKKENTKNKEIQDKYERELGSKDYLKSSTRDELYNAGITDEDLIIKVFKQKQKNPNLSDRELTRDAILATSVKNYKDIETVEKRLIKNLEQRGVFDKIIEKMEKDGKFNKIDKRLEKKYLKVDNDDNLSDKEKLEQKQKLRTREVEKEVEKEKTRMVQSEVKRIEKLSGI